MNHASLFSGIGGFDLAAAWVGWKNIFTCEINPFCRRVLKYHFPEAKHYEDIINFKGKKYEGKIDVLTGGFPCQPSSVAGKRRGNKDDRFLWPEFNRVIEEIKPGWVVAENVPGILSLERGVVFEQIILDLENQGYDTVPLLIPACGQDAPHRRNRVWIVAHSPQSRAKKMCQKKIQSDKLESSTYSDSVRSRFGATNNWPDNNKKNRENFFRSTGRSCSVFSSPRSEGWWKDFPTESPVYSRDDGFSKKLDGITFPKLRQESVRAYGNAIVPQVAAKLFMAINSIMRITK